MSDHQQTSTAADAQQAQRPPHSPSPLTMAVSFLTHLLLVWPAIYLVVLTLQRPYQLFLWHPILMTIGAGLLLPEAVLVVSGEAVLFSRVTRASRVTLHWLLHCLGILALGCGFLAVFYNKLRAEHSHFVSTHSLLGLWALSITGLVALAGLLTLKTRDWLYPTVRPVVSKIWHAFAGSAVLVLLFVALVNGTYKMHREDDPGDLARGFIIASYLLGCFLVLLRPLIGAASRCRVVFDKKKMAEKQKTKQNRQELGIANPVGPNGS